MDPTQVDDNFERQFFAYVCDVVAKASVTTPYQLQILADADFEVWWAACSRTSGSLKLLMTEQATGRQFIGTTASTISGAGTFQGINIDLFAGLVTANAAFPWAVPFVLPATRSYQLLFTDQSGADNTVELVFHGFKLWQKATANPPAGLPSQAGSTAYAGH